MSSRFSFSHWSFFLGIVACGFAMLQCSGSDSGPIPGPIGGGGNGHGLGGATNPGGGQASGGAKQPSTGGSASAVCDVPGEIFCFGECLVPSTDEHCGTCGHSCGAGSTCQAAGDGYACACPGGLLRCAAACVDPQSHPRYCGASGACSTAAEVGKNCGEGGACDGGSCTCDDQHTQCDGECVNTDSDPRHCGSSPDECGKTCKTNALCNGGNCECPDGVTECVDGCFDTDSAAQACGGCVESGGKACATDKGEECRDGSCQCPTGWTRCGDTCRDLQSAPEACGSCDKSCSGSQPACFEGNCVTGPCAAAVTSACGGVTLRTSSSCPDDDDHFSGGGFKCLGGVPSGQELCYQFDDDADFEKFRCWWSGRSMSVNGSTMPCNSAGDLYQDLPNTEAGGYCVHIPASSTPGAESDGFAVGKF